MDKESHSQKIDRSIIERLFDKLSKLFIVITREANLVKDWIVQRTALDNRNPDYYALLGDTRHLMQTWLYMLTIPLSISIDIVTLSYPLDVICHKFDLSEKVKFVAPLLLILVELAISYTSILKQRTGERTYWVGRNIQYFVIVLLVALSALSVVYVIQGYNAHIDGFHSCYTSLPTAPCKCSY